MGAAFVVESVWKTLFAPNAVEPCLFELWSPLPGNGFLKAETKSPKGLRRFKNAVAETTPPIRGRFDENREISV